MNSSLEEKKLQDANKLVIQSLPAVETISIRLKDRLSSSADVDDLIAIGVKELIKLSHSTRLSYMELILCVTPMWHNANTKNEESLK